MFFKMLKNANAQNTYLTSVSIWGLTDNPSLSKNDYNYKMNGPYCGLFDQNLKPKKAYKEVYNVLAE